MLRSQEELRRRTREAIKDPILKDILLDLTDSAWQWREGATTQAPRDRWVTVGGQTVKGTTANEKAPTTEGGQTDGQGQTASATKGEKGDKGDRGPAGEAGTGPTINHDLLPGLNAGDYRHLTASQYSALTGGADTALHFHASDRARANHTGTQLASTISDFASAADARIAAQKGVANGIAPLGSDTKIPLAYLPATTIVDTSVVASQTAMLALVAQQGDVAVRTDLSKTFILKTEPASTLANWQELLSPTDAVVSVFGRTGPVTAQAGDYSAFYQPLDADLAAIAALATTGFVRRTAADTWAASAIAWADISGAISYGTTAGTVCQGNDSRLSDPRIPTAHALDGALHTVSGKTAGQMLLATAATTFGFVAMSGDATLSGAGALTLASTITAGSGGSGTSVPVLTWDAKGRLTAVGAAAITPAGIGAATAGSLANYLPLAGGSGSAMTGTLYGKTSIWSVSGTAPTLGIYQWPPVSTRTFVGLTSQDGTTGSWDGTTGLVLWSDFAVLSSVSGVGLRAATQATITVGGINTLISTPSALTALVPLTGTSATFSSRCTQAGSTIWDAGNLAFGTGNSNMARGDHNHSGTYQPAGSYMDLSTNQTAYGIKWFFDSIKIGNSDGAFAIGKWAGGAGFAEISNSALFGGNSYGILHSADGELYLNAAPGKGVHVRVNNRGVDATPWDDLALIAYSGILLNVPTTVNASLTVSSDLVFSTASFAGTGGIAGGTAYASAPLLVKGYVHCITGQIAADWFKLPAASGNAGRLFVLSASVPAYGMCLASVSGNLVYKDGSVVAYNNPSEKLVPSSIWISNGSAWYQVG